MAYLEDDELAELGIRKLGKNVRISSRAVLYEPHLMEFGDNVRIDDFCVISGRVVLGRNVFIAVFCNVAGGQTGVFMGDFSALAYGCHVFAQRDDFTGRFMNVPSVPRKFRSETKLPVTIERHASVGTGSVIMPGVTLAEGTAVYAMSLVTKSTTPWTIYFGVPAKRLKNRHRDILEHEIRLLEFENRSGI